MSRDFGTPRYSYGGGAGREVLLQVIDVDDPEQAGRLKCRVFGYQSDKANIPDEDCHWGRPRFPISSAMDGGIGGPITGATTKTWVVGYYDDGNQQLVITHSLGKSIDGNTRKDHDVNKLARDERTGGGDYAYDDKKEDYRDKSITLYAKDESPNPYKRQHSKEGQEEVTQAFSIGMHEYKDV